LSRANAIQGVRALDEALSWARHVAQDGRVPLLIEGDDGTRMTVAHWRCAGRRTGEQVSG